MLHRSTELALVATHTASHRDDGREHVEHVDCAGGPGWFDSSWDLHRGLEVREGWSDGERVHGWIEDFLRAQRAVDRIASPSLAAAVDVA